MKTGAEYQDCSAACVRHNGESGEVAMKYQE